MLSETFEPEIIQYINHRLINLHIKIGKKETSDDILIISTKLSQNTLNDSFIVQITTSKLEGEIGIWFGSETCDIFLFNRDGESSYDFHNSFTDIESLKVHISKVFEIIDNY